MQKLAAVFGGDPVLEQQPVRSAQTRCFDPGDLQRFAGTLAGVNGDENAERTDPPMTTMVQPCYEIGLAAVGIMCHRIAKPTLPPLEAMLSAELVVRGSTSPGRRAGKGKRK
jgi:hypothetical protein